MCFICSGLKVNKFSPDEALDELEQLMDSSKISEEHYEKVEALIEEMSQETDYYLDSMKNNPDKLLKEYKDLFEQSSEMDDFDLSDMPYDENDGGYEE